MTTFEWKYLAVQPWRIERLQHLDPRRPDMLIDPPVDLQAGEIVTFEVDLDAGSAKVKH